MLNKWKLASFASAIVVMGAAAVSAAPDHDNPSGLLMYPKIAVDLSSGVDTRLHISNTSSDPTMAHCFYVNANRHCTNTGGVCESFADCNDQGVFGACVPGWIETNFDIFFTSSQPIGWVASAGLAGDELPCRATFLSPNPCFGNGSNNGTRIPPISETPFTGELKCIEADPATRLPVPCGGTGPACANNLTGHAAITAGGDVASYRAAGLEALQNDGSTDLIIGGDPAAAEYEPCAEVLVMDFVFDGAVDPIGDPLQASSELTLIPCTQDFRGQSRPPVTAQFLVYNEFEQRLSTSRRVECLLDSPISTIDTGDPTRSIFSVDVGGTITGQARVRGVGGGLAGIAMLATATDFTDATTRVGRSAYALDTVVETADSAPDTISLP